MPFDKPLPSDGIPEVPRTPESSLGHVKPDIQMQLSQPHDIAAANQFFKPSSVSKFLPDISTGHAAMTPTGAEAMLPTGAEHAVLGGAPGIPGAIPGAEPMSPLIQMIMKMPGHISIMSSFFEALSAFFAPVQDALSNLTDFLDPSTLMGGDHLSGMGDGAMELMDGGGEVGLDFGLLPDEAPILNEFSPTLNAYDASLMPKGNFSVEEFYNNVSLDEAFASAPNLEVGGTMSPGKEFFEAPAGDLNFAPGQGNFGGNYMAMNPQNDPSNAFSSTVGNQSGGTLNYSQVNAPQNNYANAVGQDGAQSAVDQTGTQPGTQSGEIAPEQGQAAGDQAASETPETTPYTVKSGDNLWDIAREHLGDGTRWGEIYHLNEGVLGANPRLIMPGTTIQLPGAGAESLSHSAMSDYTVASGDNLWDISKEHLGGGQHWPDLYKENSDVIGSNPDLIHPGQHLHMDGAAGDPSQGAAHQALPHNSPHTSPNNSHGLASHGPHAPAHHIAHHSTNLGSASVPSHPGQPAGVGENHIANHESATTVDKHLAQPHSPEAPKVSAAKPSSEIAMTNMEDLSNSQIELSAQAQSLNTPFNNAPGGNHQMPLN